MKIRAVLPFAVLALLGEPGGAIAQMTIVNGASFVHGQPRARLPPSSATTCACSRRPLQESFPPNWAAAP